MQKKSHDNTSDNQVMDALVAGKKAIRAQRRQDRRYRDRREYEDGETECNARDLCSRDPVAETAEQEELRAQVEVALAGLSETQARRVYLYFYKGFNKREIAEIEGASHQAISNSIKKSLRILKKILG